jgi:hypothetical protein
LAAVEAEDRATDGLAHLQAAAKEAIAAARAFLDVAEDLVADPAAVTAVVDAIGGAVRTVARRGREAAGDDGGHVQRIRVD